MAAMRTGTVLNPSPRPVYVGIVQTVPPRSTLEVDLDAHGVTRAVAAGRLEVLEVAPAPELEDLADEAGAADLSLATSLEEVPAAKVLEYLDALAAGDPVNLDEVARIRALEAAGKARTSVLAKADKIAPPATSPQE